MNHQESIAKIDKLIQESNKVKLALLGTSNRGNTVLSPEQAEELIRELRDIKLREILGE
jgi:hypothetical protein